MESISESCWDWLRLWKSSPSTWKVVFAKKAWGRTGCTLENRRLGGKRVLWIVLGLLFPILAAGLWFCRPMIAKQVAQNVLSQSGDNIAELQLEQIQNWQNWLGEQPWLEFAKSDAYRRSDDAVRVKKHSERAEELGMAAEQAKQPLWLHLAKNGFLDEGEAHLAKILQSYRGREKDVFESFMKGYIASWRLGDGRRLLELWREQEPEEPRLYFWEAALMAVDYQLVGAIEGYKKAVEKAPDDWEARLKLAELLVEQAQLPEAEEHFRKLYEVRPSDPSVQFGYSRCLLNQGYAAEALKLLEALPNEPAWTHSTILFLKCQAAVEAGDHEKAKVWLDDLCRRWPEVSSFRDLQARNENALGHPDEAARLFEIVAASQGRVENINRLIAEFDNDRGNVAIREKLGEAMMYYLSPESGSGQIQSALSLDPTNVRLHALMIDYYRREKNPAAALKHQRVIERLSPASGTDMPGISMPASSSVLNPSS